MQAAVTEAATAEIELPNLAEAAGRARKFVVGQLAALAIVDGEDVVERLKLVVSEFVTNVFDHTVADSLILTLSWTADGFRASVLDTYDGTPSVQPGDDSRESGRGLQLVDALADDWGVKPASPSGKEVWAWVRSAA